MDIEYYRNFIAIVEQGSISAAAKTLSLAQPALSNQLKILQRTYGTTLINLKRGGHKIELTDAGNVLYEQAKLICATEEKAHKKVRDSKNGYSGTLRICLSPSTATDFIQSTLAPFSKLYPSINFELYEANIEEQKELLLTEQCELAMVNAPLNQTFRFETLYNEREKLVAVFHKSSPLLKTLKANVTLEDLLDKPLCLSRGCSKLFLDVCADSNLSPKILSINSTKLAAIAWAKEDAGISIVPAFPEEIFSDDLVSKNILDERLYIEKSLVIIKGRTLSNVCKLFINYYLRK